MGNFVSELETKTVFMRRVGAILKWFRNQVAWYCFTLDVLYIPMLGQSLLSLGAATKMKVDIGFPEDSLIMQQNGKTIATGHRQANNLYEIDFVQVDASAHLAEQLATLQVWHNRLGHVNYGSVWEFVKGSARHRYDGNKVNDQWEQSGGVR